MSVSRFRVVGTFDRGPGEATVTINRASHTGVMEIRPLHSRSVYRTTLAALCEIAVARECKILAAEAAINRRRRKL